MLAVLSVLVILTASLIIVRVATVALTLTGLSRELARFQARSAFTGAGFTTTESEKVVHHPVRRRIIMLLMLFGNAGIVTAISSLVLSFGPAQESESWLGIPVWRVGMLLLGLGVLWYVAFSPWIDRRMTTVIAWALNRWTRLEARDYAGLLRLVGDYGVVEMQVQENGWLAEKKLLDTGLSREGILVLGVQRAQHGPYIGAPRGHTELHPGDIVILYGRRDALARLDRRRADHMGNLEHYQAVNEQRRVEQQELQEDRESVDLDPPAEEKAEKSDSGRQAD